MNDEKEKLERVIGKYSSVLYETPERDFCVYKYWLNDRDRIFIAVGAMLPRERGVPVNLYGQWEYNSKYGSRQLKVMYWEPERITREKEIISFLSSLDIGIGEVRAKRVWDKFGKDSWNIIQNFPEQLSEVKGISKDMTEDLAKKVKENGTAMRLQKLFSQAEISSSGDLVKALIKKYGTDAEEIVRENPYRPYSKVSGYSFERAESLAAYLQFPPDHEFRLVAAIFKVLNDAAGYGHVCLPAEETVQNMMVFTGCSREKCIQAIRKAFSEKEICTIDRCIYSAERYEQEKSLSDNLVRLLEDGPKPVSDIEALISEYEHEFHIQFAGSQIQAIKTVFENGLSIITGGPGVGKTTITKCILYVHQKVYGSESRPVLLAPTGKAARRMTEATGHEARTIHSAVGWRGEDIVCRDEEEMLEGNLFIIDESSMMDQFIASILFKKINSRTRTVVIGDIDQLPSVGCGNVLGDMINSRTIPTTRLDVIFRQKEDNPIVWNVHAINSGNTNLKYGPTFRFCETKNAEEILKAGCELYALCAEKVGLDNVILLNPQRNNTAVSVDAFNTLLQERINPILPGQKFIKVGKTRFHDKDKIMQLKNIDGGPQNGDTGYIRQLYEIPNPEDSNETVLCAQVEFNDDGELLEYTAKELRDCELAYCSSVHKVQGAEFDTVIMVVSKCHPSLLRRNLIYTGASRAKQRLFFVGETDALSRAICRVDTDQRWTHLADRIYSDTKSNTKKK